MNASSWKFHRGLSVLAVASAAALLAACGSAVKLDDGAPVESRSATPVTGSTATATAPAAQPATPATPAPQSQTQVATVDLSKTTPAATNAALGRVVYFDFDSFAIRDEFSRLIEGHGKALAGAPARKMMVEGHTDERGGREYNLALGQKRAQAVVKALTLVGAKEAQLEAVSFGEERPAANGSDEGAWAKNRRAELKDR